MVIPKEIREKIEQRIQLNKELDEWFKENIDTEGCDTRDVKIVDTPKGDYQGDDEYCDQSLHGGAEDWWYGDYYWKMDNGKYLCMSFDV